VAQPGTPGIVTIDGGAEEKCTTNEDTSAEWAKEYRSVEPMNEERSVKMTDKRTAGGKAEVAEPKTAEVSEPATAEVSEPATAEVSESATAEVSKPATAETMTATPKAYRRCCRGMWQIDGRNSRRAYAAFRVRQSDERKGRHYKLMLEHWSSPCVLRQRPFVCRHAGVPPTGTHGHIPNRRGASRTVSSVAGVSS
jgi:hypothetical protein